MTSASVIFSNSVFFKLDLVLLTWAVPGVSANANAAAAAAAASLDSSFDVLAFVFTVFDAEAVADALDVDGSLKASDFLSLIE